MKWVYCILKLKDVIFMLYWNVTSHLEHLKNHLHGFEVSLQPNKGWLYSTCMNRNSLVKLLSWLCDAIEWVCVMCGCWIHNDQTSRSVKSCIVVFGQILYHLGSSCSLLLLYVMACHSFLSHVGFNNFCFFIIFPTAF